MVYSTGKEKKRKLADDRSRHRIEHIRATVALTDTRFSIRVRTAYLDFNLPRYTRQNKNLPRQVQQPSPPRYHTTA